MAGSDPSGNFSDTVFRAQIRQTMQMGLPNNVAYQPTFRWVTKPEFVVHDPAKRPYNWFQSVEAGSPTNPSDFVGVCAVEYMGGSESGTEAGFINEIQVKLTILDEDMTSILAHGGSRQPDQVLLKGDLYDIRYTTVEALFTVDVYTMYCTATGAA
jgi:hypothetical protein